MSEKLLIIDGSSLLSTSFYGTAPMIYKKAKTEDEYEKALESLLQTSGGVYTNGVYTFLKTFKKIIEEQKPSHLVVTWDKTRDTFRRDIYPEYKGNRAAPREELNIQFSVTQEILNEMNIKQFVFSKYESDDIIGTLAEMFKDDIPVRLLSKDQDLVQLIDDNVKVWLSTAKSKAMFKELGIDSTTLNIPDGVFEFDEDKFRHFYNFNSCQMVDFKALAGDNSDNIPGVKGLGEKSIVPILNKFKGINDLYNFLDTAEKEDLADALLSLKDKGLKQNPFPKLLKVEEDGIMSAKDLAFLSYELALIKRDIIELSTVKLDDLILSIDETKEKKVLEKYEIRSLI